jgi:hypothetical protein
VALCTGPDKSSYYHERFLRGKPFLALGIHQIKSRADRPAKTRACDVPMPQHPNFYKMPFLPESSTLAKSNIQLLPLANKGQARAEKKPRLAAKSEALSQDSIPSLTSEPLHQTGTHRVSDLTLDHAAAAAAVFTVNSRFPLMMPSSYSGQSVSTLFPSNPLLPHHDMRLGSFLGQPQWANNHGGQTHSTIYATNPLLAPRGGNGGIISRRDVHRALVSQFIEARQPPAPRLSPPMDLSVPFHNSALVNPNENNQSDLLLDTLLRYQRQRQEQQQQQQQQQSQLECSAQGQALVENSVAAADAANSRYNPLSLLAVASHCVRSDAGHGGGSQEKE